MKRTILLMLVLGTCLTACEQLAHFKNNRTEIFGEWKRNELSFGDEEIYEFASGMIRVDGVERGNYTFRGHTKLEVVFDGTHTMYKVDFPDDRTMVWYRMGDEGMEKAEEFTRVGISED